MSSLLRGVYLVREWYGDTWLFVSLGLSFITELVDVMIHVGGTRDESNGEIRDFRSSVVQPTHYVSVMSYDFLKDILEPGIRRR